MRVRTSTAALLLALGVLSGCGGSGEGGGGTGGGAGDPAAFCASFDELNRQGADALTVERGLEVLDELADTAPDSVKADAETAQEGLHTITDAVQDEGFALSDLDDPSQLSGADQGRLQAANEGSGVDQEQLAKAFAGLEAWSKDNC